MKPAMIIMKKLPVAALTFIMVSCTTLRDSSTLPEEEKMIVTRRYVGTYLDYRNTGPDEFSGTSLIWIKTSMDSTFGKFSAYGKKCEFAVNDRLFITRNYFSPGGISGYWIYRIENDSTVSYRLTDVQYDRKVLVQNLFR
jgi:hypothetical protein